MSDGIRAGDSGGALNFKENRRFLLNSSFALQAAVCPVILVKLLCFQPFSQRGTRILKSVKN